ncbi:MAG: hypothetical protein K2M53_07750 [Muribaculaceae bacterium]|nr:hypothetical protein [Muribaculaceae bacterium]
MTEINYHIGVNEFNSSEKEIQGKPRLQVAATPEGVPHMIDGMIREDSPLGEQLRKLMKEGGYSITFNIKIDVKPISKLKLKKIRQEYSNTSNRKTAINKER